MNVKASPIKLGIPILLSVVLTVSTMPATALHAQVDAQVAIPPHAAEAPGLFAAGVNGLSPAPGWTATGSAPDTLLARVAIVDVTGDGYADVVVGAQRHSGDQAGEGAVYLYLGSPSGASNTASWTAEGNQAGAEFGLHVDPAGDVNGDGYDDVIIGAPYFDNGQTDEGRAYVYYGSATGLAATPAWTAESNQANAKLGFNVGAAGDVNRDGFDDVIVGALWYSHEQTEEGAAFVYFGSAAGLSLSPNWVAEGNQDYAHLGRVNGAGDVNGDGYADVIVGAGEYDNGQTNEGRVMVYHGSPTGPGQTPSWAVESNQAGANLGSSVSTAGDVNGDGYADVLVGAYDLGRGVVYHGSPTGLSTSADWTVETGNVVDEVSTAGDVNGDGFSDVIMGFPWADLALVFQGSPAGLSTTAAWTGYGEEGGSHYGHLLSAGDVNGDGASDVAVGAHAYAGYAGRVYLYYGSRDDPNPHLLTVSTQGTGAGTVTSSPPGIACGVDCSETYGTAVRVALTATAEVGSVFTIWTGACTESVPTCSVTMNTTRTVTATFVLAVQTPDLAGRTRSQTEAALASAGLVLGMVTTQAHATVPAGSVISQNPPAGTSVAPGTAVSLVVSSGPPPPVTGDPYEPDDTCAAARVITDTVHHRTFHKAGDADWVRFAADAGSQYVVETSAVGSQADTMLALFDTCSSSSPLADDDYGLAARIIWTAPRAGSYYVRVTNHDPTRYGSAATYDLALRKQPASPPAVIIVGGHDDARSLQINIDNVTDHAYQAFQSGGLGADRIYYLSPNTQADRDVESTSANLEWAITVWARNKVGPNVPLYLYMMDHGGGDSFVTNGSGDMTTASDLDAWLDELEAETGVDEINVIIEACRSGSFIDGVARISQAGRVVIASTSATENAYASSLGAYFSDAFLTALEDSQSLCSGFQRGGDAVRKTGLAQTPWLDDNGNGVANDPEDGARACGRGLAASFGERPPLIEGVSAPALTAGPVATVRARVQDDFGVRKVWALVYTPSFVEPPAGNTTVKLDLDEIELTDANGDREFEGTYEHFTEAGVYRLVLYAEDGAGFQALPQELTVEAAGVPGGAQPRLWLPLVAR